MIFFFFTLRNAHWKSVSYCFPLAEEIPISWLGWRSTAVFYTCLRFMEYDIYQVSDRHIGETLPLYHAGLRLLHKAAVLGNQLRHSSHIQLTHKCKSL